MHIRVFGLPSPVCTWRAGWLEEGSELHRPGRWGRDVSPMRICHASAGCVVAAQVVAGVVGGPFAAVVAVVAVVGAGHRGHLLHLVRAQL